MPSLFVHVRRLSTLGIAATLFPALTVFGPAGQAAAEVQVLHDISRSTATRATCAPDSTPETGLQGDVPAADRDNGRSTQGYTCNITRVGSYGGYGGGVVSAAFDTCAYIGSFVPGSFNGPAVGVQVLDIADPANPVLAGALTEPAMLAGTWESLKVNTTRKLLVATGAPLMTGAGLMSVYDISDCRHPRLLNPGPGSTLSIPLPITAHEGGFSPDGNTYWSSGVAPGLVSAIDLSDPAQPKVIWQGLPGPSMHGMGFSPDGNRLYLANSMGGVTIMDISAVQRRETDPAVPILSETTWTDGWATQHTVPVTYGGTPYLFAPDEAGSGGVKLIDISDETRPRVVNSIKLEINLPENLASALASSMGRSIFSYDPHYCTADRPADPTALACGWFGSGIRVFDVRDPFQVREIGYYNPPARKNEADQLVNSAHKTMAVLGAPILGANALMQAITNVFDSGQVHNPRSGEFVFGDMSSDWCTSPPHWRGNQLWVSCNDNTYSTLALAPAVYTPPSNQQTTIGS
ncbi:LVIVD repeat-containing protein [Nocardia sp. CA-120079]|uniref:LVIVD repeat-containing protein n=1 Tax=Nocardia sp. CA-120079 TaxID=3239974 RepID=UPI003D98FC29